MEKLLRNEEIAERAGAAFLGGLLRDPVRLAEFAGRIPEDDFLSGAQRAVWRQMLAMWDAGEPVQLTTVNTGLHQSGLAAGVTTTQKSAAAYLADLWDLDPAAGAVEHNARLVRNYAILRKLAFAGEEIVRLASEPNGPAEDVLEDAERVLFAISDLGCQGQAVALKECIDLAMDRIDERCKLRRERGAVPGITSGIRALDEITAGWHPGELIVIAARPSVGKTAFALALARAACSAGHAALFASLEQSRAELAERLLCAASGCPAERLRGGLLDPGDPDALLDAGRLIEGLPLWVDDEPRQSLLRIAANARRFKARGLLGLLFVDYLQLIEPENRKESRSEQVDLISRRLKALAREAQVPVIALAQLNREVENREDKRPRLADLRESGGIEQDADLVLFIYREEMYFPDKMEAKGKAEIIIGKQRSGPTGHFDVTFLGQFTKFDNLADSSYQSL